MFSYTQGKQFDSIVFFVFLKPDYINVILVFILKFYNFKTATTYKTKHTLTIWLITQTPWYLPKGGENMSAQKSVYKSLFHNRYNLETVKMSSSKWMDK